MKRLISNILRLGLVAVLAAVLFVPSTASAQYSEETTTTIDGNVADGGDDYTPGDVAGGGNDVSSAGLPRTGSSSTVPLVTVGTMLVVGGALLVFGVRRQRTTS